MLRANARELEQHIRERRADQRLAELRQNAATPTPRPIRSGKEFQQFREDFPERNIDGAGTGVSRHPQGTPGRRA